MRITYVSKKTDLKKFFIKVSFVGILLLLFPCWQVIYTISAGDLLLESERQQVNTVLQNSSEYSSRS